MASSTVHECERWFVRRGVPHLIADYDAREDIWTRSVPVLVVLYVLRSLYALALDETFTFNILVSLLVIAVLVATLVVPNLAHHRPAFSRPRQVGPPELVVYVIGPAVPSLLVGQGADAIKTTIIGLATLGIVYLATSYGAVPMLRWAAERSLALVESLGSVISRAVPLVLVSITFLFFTGEVWQSVGLVHGPVYILLLGLFVVIGGGFVLTRVPGDVRAAGALRSWEEVRALTVGTPAEAVRLPDHGAPPPLELSRRQYINVALVGLFARFFQILMVTVAVGLFLGFMGMLAINAAATTTYTGGVAPNVLLSWTFGGRHMVLTEELLRVAGFLATFGGLSFTVYLVTDATYREEFRTDMASEVREVFAVRDAYLLARAESVN
jgi:hypothetical protein